MLPLVALERAEGDGATALQRSIVIHTLTIDGERVGPGRADVLQLFFKRTNVSDFGAWCDLDIPGLSAVAQLDDHLLSVLGLLLDVRHAREERAERSQNWARIVCAVGTYQGPGTAPLGGKWSGWS